MRQPFEETDDALQIVELLDNHLAKHSHELSETLVKKYSFSYYSKASTHILQFYLEGRRFCRQPLPSLPPITPIHGREGYGSSPLSCVSTPMSSSMSSESDDMPVTPTSPCIGDPFSVAVAGADDKENILPPSMQMHIMQHQHHSPAVKHVSDDASGIPATMFPVAPGAVTFGRPKLNEINRAVPARVPTTPRTANLH